MLKKIIFKVVSLILLLCVLVSGYCIIINIISKRNININVTLSNSSQYYEALNILENELHGNVCCFSKEEYRKYIEDKLELKFYFYKEKNLKPNINGETDLYTRTIYIHKDLNEYNYYRTFLHEAIHLKKCTTNELYVSFETFRLLYEDEVFHSVGVNYAYNEILYKSKLKNNIREQVIYYLTQK